MNKGFTFIEMTVVLAICSLLFYLASASFIKLQQGRLLKDYLEQVIAVIRRAQSKVASGESLGESHLEFGVLFAPGYYQEFATLSDYANREVAFDLVTELPRELEFTDLNLPDTCLVVGDCLIYSALEATPSAGGSFILRNQSNGDFKTVFVNALGKVEF